MHVQDDLNLCILRMFEGTLLLDMAHISIVYADKYIKYTDVQAGLGHHHMYMCKLPFSLTGLK